MLYSRFLLVIYFIHSINTVYMSIPISQFLPPSPIDLVFTLSWYSNNYSFVLLWMQTRGQTHSPYSGSTFLATASPGKSWESYSSLKCPSPAYPNHYLYSDSISFNQNHPHKFSLLFTAESPVSSTVSDRKGKKNQWLFVKSFNKWMDFRNISGDLNIPSYF